MISNKLLERLALLVVILLVAVAAAIPLLGWARRPETALVHAHMAETGGWTPENLKAEVGVPLRLRLTSDDVMHSFAVGQSEQPAVDVKPGEISEVTLTFDRPGKYTFYCTRWCSLNHWRMRGVIEVTGPGKPVGEGNPPPLYLTLGLDIDAKHAVDIPLPGITPSAERGAELGIGLPGQLMEQDYYRSHSPADAFKALKAQPDMSDLPDQQIWDLVALAWKGNITPQSLENGRELYAENCAACHGESGAGDGVFAADLAPKDAEEHKDLATGEMIQAPTDFTQAEHMLAASPAHLQGKILRGGMGTGMPYWGPIFTDPQTWDLVAALWTFQFDLEDRP